MMHSQQSFALPALAEQNSRNSNGSPLKMRINGRQYPVQRPYTRPVVPPMSSPMSYQPKLAFPTHSLTNKSHPVLSNPSSSNRPFLHLRDHSSSRITDISYVRCTSAELRDVLDDVDLEYGDSMSSEDLHPFGREMPSETFHFENTQYMCSTTLVDNVVDIITPPIPSDNLSFVPEHNKMDDISSIFHRRGVLGSGASCRVLRARHLEMRKDFALKEMSRSEASNLRKFKQEVEVLDLIQHPNIVQLEDCYIDEHSYYVATEYCSGYD